MYKVIDKITREILTFTDQFEAEAEAERRLARHRSGYEYKHNMVAPLPNATIRYLGRTFVVCLNSDSLEKTE